MVRDGGVGGSMPGRVPTEWPNLVGMAYLTAHQIICTERPDVYIEENPAGAIIPPGIPRTRSVSASSSTVTSPVVG
jgi:hypothetical protein